MSYLGTDPNSVSTPLAIGLGGTGSSSAAAAKTALGLVPGTDVQAYDAATAKTNVAQVFTAVQKQTVVTASSASYTWADPNTNVELTTTGNLTMNAPTVTAGAFYFLEIIYGGAHTVTWNANFKGVATKTLTSTTGAHDAFMFRAVSSSVLECIGFSANVGAA